MDMIIKTNIIVSWLLIQFPNRVNERFMCKIMEYSRCHGLNQQSDKNKKLTSVKLIYIIYYFVLIFRVESKTGIALFRSFYSTLNPIYFVINDS